LPKNRPHLSNSQAGFNQTFARVLVERLRKLLKDLGRIDKKISRRQIHQWRVLSRRSRAALRVLRDSVKTHDFKVLSKKVKFLTKSLGPLRSLDVSQDVLKQDLKSRPRDFRKKLEFCTTALQKSRIQERQAFVKKIRNAGFRRGLDTQIRALNSCVAELPALAGQCRQQCLTARAKARKALAQFRRSGTIPHLHQLRIRLKQWRYLLELQDQAGNSRLRLLKSLQDQIGELHDLEMLRQFLQRAELVKGAQRNRAQKELQTLVNDLKSKIETGGRRFLPQRHRDLNRLLSARYA